MKNVNRVKKVMLGLVVLPSAAYAVLSSADDLSVGAPQSNTVTNNSLSVGVKNTSTYHSFTSGASNWAHDLSMASGYSNEVMNLSGAVGYSNRVNRDAAGQHPRHSFATGFLNDILGNSSLAAGRENEIDADEAGTIGRGLLISQDRAVGVGSYNVDTEGVRFVVGNGTGDQSRSNALEVYENGDVIIPKVQGDISMGIYGQ